MRSRRLWIALLLCALFAVAVPARSGTAQAPDDWTAPYRAALLPAFHADMVAHTDAPRYSIDMRLALSDAEVSITGQQTVFYTNCTPGIALTEIAFRLYPNLESYGGTMTVSAVSVDGVPVTSALDESRSVLRVPLPEALPARERVTIAMTFEVTVQTGRVRLYGQFAYRDGVLSLPHAHPMLAVYEPGPGWWDETAHPQGDIVFSESAFYDVRITAPANLLLATTGTTVALDAHSDGTLTHHIVAPLVRDFAIAASADFVTLNGEQDGVRITLYYNPDLPGAADASRTGLQITRDALRIFNAAFGPYPFSELDVVQAPNGAGGLEFPGLFVIDSGIWQTGDPLFEFLIVHETAHQWWYSLVGSDQARAPWLDEALAQFSVTVYIRAQEGTAAYDAALESFRIQHANFTTAHPDQRIGRPVSAYPDRAYFFIVYQKGPLFYAALDDLYGYDAVLAMLREYFAAYRYRIAYPDDLRARFEASLGVDLSALYAEWIAPLPVG